ncbi:hypothetical protein AHAS_Ahas11G0172700 [Arachis hypogaea]
METRILFYELDHPHIYKDPVYHSFYIIAAEPRVRLYVLRDHPFQHPIDIPFFDLDTPYEFPLSWLHPGAPYHPFPDETIHFHPVQPEDQVVPPSDPVNYTCLSLCLSVIFL